ncbi:MAG: HAD-IB family hydrolase [Polyangiaceae bacterium]
MTRRLALFDMDRTLLRTETASLYVQYQRDVGLASGRDLLRTLWWVAKYTAGILDATAVAEIMAAALRDQPEAEMIARCEDWFVRYVEEHIAELGRACVERHRGEGDVCAIVTGATFYASRPLARVLDIPHVVASGLEVDARGRFTGRPLYPLCFGVGKLERAETFAKSVGASLDDAVFYSDSISDLPLLERVREPVVVNPDPRLARVARQRAWTILAW